MARITRKVEDVLRRSDGAFLCCKCIAERLGSDDLKAIHRVTSEISNGSNPEFSKYPGKCALCATEGIVARAHERLVWA
jgi:hypothetical protein